MKRSGNLTLTRAPDKPRDPTVSFSEACKEFGVKQQKLIWMMIKHPIQPAIITHSARSSKPVRYFSAPQLRAWWKLHGASATACEDSKG